MSFLNSVTRSKIFLEFDEETRENFFSIKNKKYIHHIDTFYYTCFLKYDSKENDDKFIKDFIYILNEYSSIYENSKEKVWYDYKKSILYKKFRYKCYDHLLSHSFFDIFICSSLPNDVTPRILVQLRSLSLWSQGERGAINYSFNILNEILSQFNIEVDYTKENRIDYCFHTNSVQNPNKFFTDDIIKNNIISSFRIGSKTFRKNNKNFTVEYLCLGNRNSNCAFFRAYNKTREVVEKGYKNFFLELWLGMGLISYYDYEIYSFCYQKKSYDQIPYAQIEFYLKYGSDDNIKNELINIKKNTDLNLDTVRKRIKGLCPDPTLILNIEYQTMRKFYKSGEDLIKTLPILEECDPKLFNLFQILDNRKIYLDYLTSKTVSFVKDSYNSNSKKKKEDKEIYLDWWYRLRRVKLDNTINIDFTRTYSTTNDINKTYRELKACIAKINVLQGNFETDINQDLSCVLSLLNDNDFEIDDYGTVKLHDDDYKIIKEKKKKALKSYIDNISRPSNNNNTQKI